MNTWREWEWWEDEQSEWVSIQYAINFRFDSRSPALLSMRVVVAILNLHLKLRSAGKSGRETGRVGDSVLNSYTSIWKWMQNDAFINIYLCIEHVQKSLKQTISFHVKTSNVAKWNDTISNEYGTDGKTHSVTLRLHLPLLHLFSRSLTLAPKIPFINNN